MSTTVRLVPRLQVKPLITVSLLVALAAWLVSRAVVRLVDSSGQLALPAGRDLYLFLGLPVVGLLGLRSLVPVTTEQAATIARWCSRWSGVWAGVTLGSLLLTTAQAAGVSVFDLPRTADNLIRVMAADNTVLAQATVFWVALLTAGFAASLASRAENLALLLLTVVAVLGAVPTGFSAPSHGGHTFHPLVVAAAVAQLVTIAAWLGAVSALVAHRRLLQVLVGPLLERYAVAASVAVAVTGLAGLISRASSLPAWSEVWTTPAGWVLLGEAVLVAAVVGVGARHRRRVAELVTSASTGSALEGALPPARLLALMVASDLVIGLVVLGVSLAATTGTG